MFRQVLFLAIVLSAVFACNIHAAVINSTWVGGESAAWDQASNWNPPIIPDNGGGNTFVVTIDGGVNYAKIFLMQSRTVSELNCRGTVELQKWTSNEIGFTSDPNGLINYGNLAIDKIDLRGDVVNKSGGSIEFWEDISIRDGNLINEANAKLILFNTSIDIIGGVIENDGLILCFLSGSLETQLLENRGSISLFGGWCTSQGVFDNNRTGNIEGYGTIGGQQTFLNKGTIQASSGTLLLLNEGSIVNADSGLLMNKPLSSLHLRTVKDVNNAGTIQANPGGGIAFDCNLVNEPNGVIKLLGGILAATTITQAADANFSGLGTINGDVIIEPSAVVQITGPTTIFGDVNISSNATLEISDGQTLITGHTTNSGTVHLIGGTVIFQGGYECDGCNIINEAGTDRNHFDINADGTENFKDLAEFAESWLWQASWYD